MEKGVLYEDDLGSYSRDYAYDESNDETFGVKQTECNKNDADTFFGFKTEIPDKRDMAESEGLEQFDELNEETFGDGAADAAAGDWDALHEQMMERDFVLRDSAESTGISSQQPLDQEVNTETPSHIQELLEALSLQMTRMDNTDEADESTSKSGSYARPINNNQPVLPPGLSRSLAGSFDKSDEVFDANTTINMLPDFLLGSYGNADVKSEQQDNKQIGVSHPQNEDNLLEYYKLMQARQDATTVLQNNLVKFPSALEQMARPSMDNLLMNKAAQQAMMPPQTSLSSTQALLQQQQQQQLLALQIQQLQQQQQQQLARGRLGLVPPPGAAGMHSGVSESTGLFPAELPMTRQPNISLVRPSSLPATAAALLGASNKPVQAYQQHMLEPRGLFPPNTHHRYPMPATGTGINQAMGLHPPIVRNQVPPRLVRTVDELERSMFQQMPPNMSSTSTGTGAPTRAGVGRYYNNGPPQHIRHPSAPGSVQYPMPHAAPQYQAGAGAHLQHHSRQQHPEFDHWMSDRDIETIKRIQQLQLHADQRHMCDPYGQILLRKKMFSQSAVDVVTECDVHLKWYLLNMLMYRKPMEVRSRPEPPKFEGALGTLLSSTVNNPTTLFNAIKHGSKKLSNPVSELLQKPSLLLYHIEAMYSLWNEVELEMDNGTRYVLGAINTHAARNYDHLAQMNMLITYTLNEIVEQGLHLDSNKFFKHYMAVQKGKELLLVLLPYWNINNEKAGCWWGQLLTVMVKNLKDLIQTDKRHNVLMKLLPIITKAYPLLEINTIIALVTVLQQDMFDSRSKSGRSSSQLNNKFCAGLYVGLWSYLQQYLNNTASAPVGNIKQRHRGQDLEMYDSFLTESLRHVNKHYDVNVPDDWYENPTKNVSKILHCIVTACSHAEAC